MKLVVGTLLLAAGTILFAWAYVQFRRPQPARWTRHAISEHAVILTWCALSGLGLGYVAAAGTSFDTAPPTTAEIGAVATSLAVTVAILASLRVNWRRLAAKAISLQVISGGGPTPAPAGGPSPSVGTGQRGQRKKAA